MAAAHGLKMMVMMMSVSVVPDSISLNAQRTAPCLPGHQSTHQNEHKATVQC